MPQQQVTNTQDVTITLNPSNTVQSNLEVEVKGYDQGFSSLNPSNDTCCEAVLGDVSDGEATLTITGQTEGYAKVIIKSKDNPSITKELQVTVGAKITTIDSGMNELNVTVV